MLIDSARIAVLIKIRFRAFSFVIMACVDRADWFVA